MQQVRYFIALSRTLNFTRAAEECNVTQPALTRAIQQLEAELGGALIRREGRLSHLTDLGQRMLPLLRQCYDSAQSAAALARSVKTRQLAAVSIAVSRAVNLDLLIPALTELARAYPGIQLKLKRASRAEIAPLLKNGEVELAVAGPLDENWDRLDAWPMFTEDFELVVGPDHAIAKSESQGVVTESLKDERFLLHVACEMADAQAARLSARGVSPVSAHEVETVHDLAALLQANLGVAIAPKSCARAMGAYRAPFADLDLNRTVTVYGASGRQRTPEATTLLNLLRSSDWSAVIN
jgi:DNA-binding transcriptional LysR family regulator